MTLEFIKYTPRIANITIVLQDWGVTGVVWNVWAGLKNETAPMHTSGRAGSIGAARVIGNRMAEDFADRLGCSLGIPVTCTFPATEPIKEPVSEPTPAVVPVGLGHERSPRKRGGRGE